MWLWAKFHLLIIMENLTDGPKLAPCDDAACVSLSLFWSEAAFFCTLLFISRNYKQNIPIKCKDHTPSEPLHAWDMHSVLFPEQRSIQCCTASESNHWKAPEIVYVLSFPPLMSFPIKSTLIISLLVSKMNTCSVHLAEVHGQAKAWKLARASQDTPLKFFSLVRGCRAPWRHLTTLPQTVPWIKAWKLLPMSLSPCSQTPRREMISRAEVSVILSVVEAVTEAGYSVHLLT